MELSDDALRSIVAHLAHVRAQYGEVLADVDLIEPTSEYFPDEFKLEPESIERLMRRMMSYAPLADDLGVELVYVEPESHGGGGGGGCGGSCGPKDAPKVTAQGNVVETEDGYAVMINASDVGETKLLTASLARSVGRLVLFEADEEVDPRLEGPLAELTAVACGLGTILLSGASVYKKACSGMRRHQGTFLGVEELALACALFVRVTDRKPAVVRKHLEITQREAFDAALAWTDGQPKLVRALAELPESLTDGIFKLEEKKGLLSRLLSRKADEEAPEAIVAPKPKERSEEERRRLAEAKALVEEALQEP